MARLVKPDDVRAYVELGWGIGFHLIAAGAARRYGSHQENHQGLARWLRERGHGDVAGAWEELEALRGGRWYGRQGNGDAADRTDELLAQIDGWSVAEGSA